MDMAITKEMPLALTAFSTFLITLSIICPLALFLPLGLYLIVPRFYSYPQLLVPEQQFAPGFIELQPVNFGVVADGSQIVASGQVHWGEK